MCRNPSPNPSQSSVSDRTQEPERVYRDPERNLRGGRGGFGGRRKSRWETDEQQYENLIL